MFRSCLIVSALTLVASSVSAAPLTPEEALQRLEGDTGARARGIVDTHQRYSYVSLPESVAGAFPKVYVFADAAGHFLLAPSDSNAPALLGYGDGFDAGDIPEPMQWWLGEYSRQVAWLASHPCAAASGRTAHAAVNPLVTTKWNQSDPFNRKCPTENGRRCMTGCVATAMAQVVNYHEWPQTKGTGTYSYTWKGQTHSFDYGATTFDWANMRDTYGAGSPAAACDAVATLMFACGVSVEMQYGASESGAYSYQCPGALTRNFGFDAGGVYVMRDYYSAEDWDAMIYAELAAGRPVLYDGQSTTGAHAFVCDGYDGQGKYHINWGWGGTSDGYFLLSALDPYQQGIGGSTSGYNYGQGASIRVQPPVEGSERSLAFYANGGFAYSDQYSAFWFGTGSDGGINGYFNYSMLSVDAENGVRFVSDSGSEAYVAYETATYEPLAGKAIIRAALPAGALPGTYRAYPVARHDGSAVWHDILVPYGTSEYVTVRKGENGVVTYDGSDPDAIEVPVRATDLQQSSDWTSGNPMLLYLTLNNTSASDQDVRLGLRLENPGDGTSSTVGYWKYTVPAGASERKYLSLGDCTLADGVYTVTAVDGALGADISAPQEVYVGVRPKTVEVTPRNVELKTGETRALAVTVTPSDAFDPTVIWSSSDSAVAAVDAAGRVTGIGPGNATITATTVNGLKADALVTVSGLSGVDEIQETGDVPVDVYNMQGIQVRSQVRMEEATTGLPAGVYIVGGRKVRVR